jgi:hypothetical protein
MIKIRELLRWWRRWRLEEYALDQRAYQQECLEAADRCMADYTILREHAQQHARAARRAEIELEEMDNERA